MADAALSWVRRGMQRDAVLEVRRQNAVLELAALIAGLIGPDDPEPKVTWVHDGTRVITLHVEAGEKSWSLAARLGGKDGHATEDDARRRLLFTMFISLLHEAHGALPMARRREAGRWRAVKDFFARLFGGRR
jgi:hypothetical protein